MTIKMFKENNLSFKGIYFGQEKKSDIAKNLNIDSMVDDSVYVYNNMKKENIDCILFGNKTKTWKEALDYIKNKEEIL